MKLLADLFACQTASRLRGIGRYVLSLTSEMAKLRGKNEMILVADALYPQSFENLRQRFIRLLPAGSFLPYFHEPAQFENNEYIAPISQIASAQIQYAYQRIAPDILLTPSHFEGWSPIGEKGIVPDFNDSCSTYCSATILYDLIPYIFQEQYLDKNPNYKTWYLEKVKTLSKYDLFLSISESTKQDAANIFGIQPDRIFNISGATGSIFKKLPLSESAKLQTLQRFGITRPFVLYIGGDDFRKNKIGALRTYAQLPRSIIQSHQLVINSTGGKGAFLQKARTYGLTEKDVVVIENLKDEDLNQLYNLCKAFYFPSLYEGLGLPVLEAMTCGAAVVASNNSSMPELIGRSDNLFDVSSDQEATDCLYKVLTDDSFRSDLAAYGLKRAEQFTWKRSASLAWEAIEAFTKEKEQKKSQFTAPAPVGVRSRVAFVSPTPPESSSITEYSAALLTSLSEHFEIDLFCEPGIEIAEPQLKNFNHYDWASLLDRRDQYETVIYAFRNSELHAYMLDLLQEMPGVVILHDFFMGNLPSYKEQWGEEKNDFLQVVSDSHSSRGVIETVRDGVQKAREKWPGNWKILKNSLVLIFPDDQQVEAIQKFYGHGWMPKPVVMPRLSQANAITTPIEKYVEAIHQAKQVDERKLLAPLIDALYQLGADDTLVQRAARDTAANANLRCQPRILIDSTCLAKANNGTGIQRVVLNLVKEFLLQEDLALKIEPVRLSGDQIVRANSFPEHIFDLPPNSLGPDILITVQPGDTLFMLDSSWEVYTQFAPIFERVRKMGGKIITMVYDLIPINFSETCHYGIVDVFEPWLNYAIQASDEMVCISRAVADDLADYIARKRVKLAHQLDISYIHLGANITTTAQDAQISEPVRQLTDDKTAPIFLMVGTLEPRKGHAFVLDAFDALWQAGYDYRLAIGGKIGWNVAKTETRIRNHPELGKRLFLFESPTDAEINALYAASTGLIAASVSEGFGLPIVEAALHKTPVLASDIPVFREVGGDGAMYFSLSSPAYLVDAVISLAKLNSEERKGMADRIKVLTWKDSADWMLELLNGKRVYKAISQTND